MKGLRTQEESNFKSFFKLVQDEASKQKKIFFLDTSEGKDNVINGVEVCELSGWLIPKEKSKEFESVWREFKENDKWVDFFVFVIPTNKNGQLEITFEEE